jgi:hypothetical protein
MDNENKNYDVNFMHKIYRDTILGGFQKTKYCKSQSLCVISEYCFFKSRKLVSKVLLKQANW